MTTHGVDTQIDLTFVIPAFNEAKFLPATLGSLAAQELGGIRAEILVVDGRSEDNSAEIVRSFENNPTGQASCRLLDNPRRRTPAGFNTGIANARGRIIGFGGAHTVYPPHFFAAAVNLIDSGVAEVVGGGWNRYVPSTNTILGRAMALLYSSPMGAGVAAYHRRTTPGLVDTVYGGFYKREVFSVVGTFDESLTRNQDNELNARVVAAGMKIYFDPVLSTEYLMKTELLTFLRRGYMFGLYHPQTWSLNPKALRLRHLIPAVFVLYLVTAAIVSLIFPHLWYWIPLLLYGILLTSAAVALARTHSILVAFTAIPLFFGFHVAYGSGTLAGAAKLGLKQSKQRP